MRALYGSANPTPTSATRNNGDGARLPDNWRDRMPDPGSYYAAMLDKLGRPNGAGYASAPCPFHDDRSPSLSVNVGGGGGWVCHAGCGKGDMVSFHMRSRGVGFKEAIRELVRGYA